MPPNDTEPRYRLVDSNGNVVGSFFQNADGNVEIQDETGTGSVFGPDGIVTPAIDAESVSAGLLRTDVQGARLTKESDQAIADNTLTEVSWESASEKNANAEAFADLSNNALTIPNSEYSYARLTVAIRTTSAIEWDLVFPLLNGSPADGLGRTEPKTAWQSMTIQTDWVSVSSGDSFSVEFRQTSGSEQTIDGNPDRTYIALEAV